MAKKKKKKATAFDAMSAYTPRVTIKYPMQLNDVAEFISGRTSLNRSAVVMTLMELHEAMEFFLTDGESVKLPGIGVFSPGINSKGTLRINYRPDKELTAKINKDGAFTGTIKNKDMIGKSQKEMIERWNEEHPDEKIKD